VRLARGQMGRQFQREQKREQLSFFMLPAAKPSLPDSAKDLLLAGKVSPVPSDRPSAVRRIASLARFEERAPGELAGYFARSQSGEPLRAEDADVEAILGSLSGYHRGVLSLHHGARVWPEAVTRALCGFASLGVRLYCADHPATGSTPELERAAAEGLAAKAAVADVDKEASAMLFDLMVRASRHYERAVRAYAKAARRSARAKA
jgi:hypothetical protein